MYPQNRSWVDSVFVERFFCCLLYNAPARVSYEQKIPTTIQSTDFKSYSIYLIYAALFLSVYT